MSVNCYKCEKTLELTAQNDIGRSEECPSCYASLRCCRMCGFYDKNSYNECREPSADRVVEKEKPNFCDYFKLGADQTGDNTEKSALDAANALFKK
ncbi:MAG: hypothetical protein CME65_09240 [Halobacteriovoraceae bacterium]|nr:hypothetical protein [Halobacteriovoraceae bacterium]|tara:strand:- start:26124 stop:26411 length:288 start_codon:yes stop_codon:yes gene_type:complete